MIRVQTDKYTEWVISLSAHACKRLEARTASYFKEDVESAIVGQLLKPEVEQMIQDEIAINQRFSIDSLLPGVILPSVISIEVVHMGEKESKVVNYLNVLTVLSKSLGHNSSDKQSINFAGINPIIEGGCYYA